jgi:hypothetical protein
VKATGKKAPRARKAKKATKAAKASKAKSTKNAVICLKRHCSGSEILIAACDEELLGKCIGDGDVRLEVDRRFYEGERVDVRLFLETLALATIANLVGPDTVGAAIEAGFVDPACVLRINGVPHAQLFRM